MGVGNMQVINGKSYVMYSPEWYKAQQTETQRGAEEKGTAAGTTAGAALNALQSRVPDVYGRGVLTGSRTSSSSSTAGGGLPYVGAGGTGGVGGVGGGGVAGAGPSAGGLSLPREPNPAEGLNRATEINLARAKERQGQLARSAVTGLRGALGERGVLGSGIETGATQGIASNALQSLTDINRQGMIDEDEQARALAALTYQGGVSQRGQDLSGLLGQLQADVTRRGQDVTQRGQDVTMRGQDLSRDSLALSQQQQYQNMILEALRSLSY